MRKAIEPTEKTSMESLKTHLDGNFELFVENILDETRLKPANTPQGKYQREQSRKREEEQQGKPQSEWEKIVANRAKERQQGTPAATMQAQKERRPLIAAHVKKATAGAKAKAEEAGEDAKTKAGKAAAEKIGKARKEAARLRYNTRETIKAAKASAEKRASAAEKKSASEVAATRAQREKSAKSYLKAKARMTGKKDAFFRKNRPEYKAIAAKKEKELTQAKAEAKYAPKLAKAQAEGERKAAMARLKATEGGRTRRTLRFLSGREGRFQRRLAQYGSEKFGGGVGARQAAQAASEKAQQRKEEATKRASEKIVGESKRGRFDSLIREGATRQ